MEEIDLSYIAGLFDGEGCIHIRANTTNAQKIPRYSLLIQITNSDRRVLEWIQEQVGFGQIGKGGKTRNLQVYVWRAYSKQAREVLLSILPFMRIKKEQAGLAINLQEEITSSGFTNRGIPKDVLIGRELQRQQVSDFNGGHRRVKNLIPVIEQRYKEFAEEGNKYRRNLRQ